MSNTRRPLVGLINYSYLAAKNGLLLISGAAIILGIITLVDIRRAAGGAIAFGIIPLLGLLLMAGPILSIVSNSDGASGWRRYQAAMPVSRGQLVAAKFLSILLGITVAALILLLLMAALFFIDELRFHALSESGQWVTNGVMVVVTPLLAAAAYLPLSSTRRSRGVGIALLLICLIVAFAASQFLYAGVNRFIFQYGTTSSIVFWTTIGITALTLLISFLLTRLIYARTSF